MTGPLGWLAGAEAAALLALGIALARSRRRLAKSSAALDAAMSDLEQLQNAFHRFAPQDVVEEIIRRGIATRGERRAVTVLFADLKGFTSMSERMDPEALVRIINGYLVAMSRAISEHRGHVSKFIGDGILALFGAPDPNPWQAIDAVRAALAMRAAMAAYNARLAREGGPALEIGIGIHGGDVVAGVIGSEDLVEFTVIGDVVNTASRVEGLTRTLGADILATEPVRAALDERFLVRAMPPSEVKGKSEPIATYAIESFREFPTAG